MSAHHQRTVCSGYDLRILRAAVFAAVCVVLAAAGHGLASCAAIPLWTLGAGFLGVFTAAAVLAGRERSLPGIAALLAVGQTVLHTLFGLGQHSGAVSGAMPTADTTLVERAARIMCGVSAAALSPAQAQKILTDARLGTGTGPAAMHPVSGPGRLDTLATAGEPWSSMLPSLPMLLAHVLAGVAAGWVLRRGDMALLRLIRLSAHSGAEGALVRSLRSAFALVRALLAGRPEAGVRPRAWRAWRTWRTWLLVPPNPRTTALHHAVIRRGPPLSSAPVFAA